MPWADRRELREDWPPVSFRCLLGFHKGTRVDPKTAELLQGKLPPRRCIRCGARLTSRRTS